MDNTVASPITLVISISKAKGVNTTHTLDTLVQAVATSLRFQKQISFASLKKDCTAL
jgi:hypothetical protein